MGLRDLVRTLREHDELVGFGEIARRYFAMNAFDGAVTIIGVLVGNMMAGIEDPRVVLTTGLATALAMGISGIWGAYLTEAAERRRAIGELERQTLTDLSKSKLARASRTAVIVVTIVDGLSPLLAALLALVPFMISGLLPSIDWAYCTGLGITLATLIALGAFLGRVSRGKMWVYALKTALAGLVAIGLGFLLRGIE